MLPWRVMGEKLIRSHDQLLTAFLSLGLGSWLWLESNLWVSTSSMCAY